MGGRPGAGGSGKIHSDLPGAVVVLPPPPDRSALEGPEDERASAWEQYRLAVEEYRFQVDLNWKRSEYYFALNVGVLIAAVGLLATSTRVPRWLIAVLFGVGLAIACLSIFANRTQHNYYRQARDEAIRQRDALGLPESALATTPGMGSARSRWAKVGTWQVIMLATLALADAAGLAYAVTQELDDAAPVDIVIELRRADRAESDLPLILSRQGESVARAIVREGRATSVRLRPGGYEIWAIAGGRVCRERVEVRDRPLQRVVVLCTSKP